MGDTSVCPQRQEDFKGDYEGRASMSSCYGGHIK